MSLNDKLLKAATVDSGITPSENFKVVTYTGNSGTQAITGVGFKPDLVWTKVRVGSNSFHILADSTRGGTKAIFSNSTNAEQTRSNHIQSFDSDGFTLGADGTSNYTGETYVAWCWKANGGTTSSNTDGSITSTVQANTDAGFSIVTWTSTSTISDTIGHSLNKKPDVVLYKKLSGTSSWYFYTDVIDGSWDALSLNLTDAKSDVSGTWATSSTFKSITSVSGSNWITYCFHSVDGFSKFGTYTGTGASGNFIETGFEPAFIMFKRTDSTGGWLIFDNKRNLTNPRNTRLEANNSQAEQAGSTSKFVDFYSNGFEPQVSDSEINANGGTYLYMAFAADPDTEAPTLASSFNIEEYTGTNAAQSITGLGFKPGLVWWKNRSGTNSHALADIVRGANKYIHSDGTQAQNVSNGTSEDCISFDTDGFSIGTVQNAGSINTSGGSIVAWSWKADDNEPTIFGGNAKAVYKFEDNVNDVSGNFNGSATSITYNSSGKFNKSAEFNGSNSQITTSLAQSDTAAFTWSAWIKVHDFQGVNNVNVLGTMNPSSPYNGVAIFLDVASISLGEGGSNIGNIIASPSINTWYHIVVAYDGSIFKCYVDGSLALTVTNSNTDGGNFWMGKGGPTSWTAFDGELDQVRVYNGAVSDIGVAALYAETVSQNDDLSLAAPKETLISANANAGFSIVKYTGTSSAATVAHGLSSTPEMIIVKKLGATQDWWVYHKDLNGGTNPAHYFIRLNLTDAETLNASSGGSIWNSTAPTSTVFSTGTTLQESSDYIAYCFHSVSGYSKIGSYTGNGSTNAITTGFKPDFVLIKTSSDSDHWVILDSRRGGTKILQPNLSNAESTESGVNVSFTSTGFTHTGSGGGIGQVNSSGSNYIYWAVAKNVPSNTTLANSFKIIEYDGNSSAEVTISGLGFRPDFVWLKSTTPANEHNLYDTIRGAFKKLRSDDTAAEASTGALNNFTNDGFTLRSGGYSLNQTNNSYVAWCWKAGNTWQSNADGTIPSTVNANTANGFSIVHWYGTQAAGATVGHGLSAVPEWIIVKRLDYAEDWVVYHSSLGNTKTLNLNNTDAEATDAAFNNTTPTSSVFTLSNCASGSCINSNSGNYIAYCWAPKSGFSKFGTYSGGSTGSGNAITTGFQPDWIMIKRTDTADDWTIIDSERGDGSNSKRLIANNNDAEKSPTSIWFPTSTGFYFSGTGASYNSSGGTYIYMTFKMN